MKEWLTQRLTARQRWWAVMLGLALVAYVGLAVAAPRAQTSANPYHFSVVMIVVLSVTIIGLLLAAWIFGFYAWLELDRYAERQADAAARRSFGQIALGVGLLAAGLIVSSLLSAAQPFYASDVGLVAATRQVNYYVMVLFPFFGFLLMRIGSRRLAVSVQAAMSTRAKLLTVGPPVVLLAAFYVFLALTNSPSDTTTPTVSTGIWLLALNILLVVGTWVLGLLTALNIERATYRGEGARHAQPLVKLYNGILTTTGGFIILDALMSLGNTRLLALPVQAIVFLIYAFIGVVALGFALVALAGRALLADSAAQAEGRG